MSRQAALTDALELVAGELRTAVGRFPPFSSPHEGYAVILEELEELWEHVRCNTGRTLTARHEAIQLAAMAARYIAELTPAAGPSSSEEALP